MKKFLPTAVALLVFCIPLRAGAEPVSPKPNQTEPQEPHWQLFLDDYIIERSTGFRRVLHHPQPRGLVLKPDKPWERSLTPQYVGWRKDGRLECYYVFIYGERVVPWFWVEVSAYSGEAILHESDPSVDPNPTAESDRIELLY